MDVDPYRNDSDVTVAQGARAQDEMCAMIGIYYPRDAAFELCNADGNFLTESTGTLHIGSGAASCTDTMAFLAKAKPFAEDFGRSMGPCYRNSCPAAAKSIAGVTACMAALKATDDPTRACAQQLDTCSKSVCQ